MDAPRVTVTVNPDDPSEGKADAPVTMWLSSLLRVPNAFSARRSMLRCTPSC